MMIQSILYFDADLTRSDATKVSRKSLTLVIWRTTEHHCLVH